MKVQVLFFGATAQETGEREIELDLAEHAKAADALASIVAKNTRCCLPSIKNIQTARKQLKTATNSQCLPPSPAADSFGIYCFQ